MSHPRISVRDVMKPDVDMVDGMTTVADALINMKHTDSKCLIVKKRDDNDEYGIVTLSDIAKKVLAVDRAPERVNIYEIMTKPVIDVDPNMDIRSRFPLRGGMVSVKEDASNPGFFDLHLILQPHLQLEGVNAELTLISKLPRSKE